MYEKLLKPKHHKTSDSASSTVQNKSRTTSGFSLVDNRPEASVQRKLQQKNNTNSKVRQLQTKKNTDTFQTSVNAPIQFDRGKRSKHNRKAGRLAKMQGVERSIPMEERRGFSVTFKSKTTNPYTSSEVRRIIQKVKPGGIFKINPARIRTMHAGISGKFSDDSEMMDLVEKLKENPSYIDKTPTIKVSAIELPRRKWERTNPLQKRNKRQLTLFTEDHRRVVAARTAGITSMKAQMKAEPSVTGNYTTKNRGMSVDVRKYNETTKGRHQGGNKTTLPSSAKVFKYGDPEE
ncbi:MAG: hypothetical protein AB8B65_12905 [Kordia sp.]|uniref:hypothetical protein n=1 Tax=Kordia sp. TaxID=1965332 RepID=UPI0038599304